MTTTIELTRDVYNAALELFDSMKSMGISRLRAITYWYDDEDHIQDSVDVFYPNGDEKVLEAYQLDGLEELLWAIDGSGLYEVDAIHGTITRIGEAYMPDPEVETKLIDNPVPLAIPDVYVDPPLAVLTPILVPDNAFDHLWNELAYHPLKQRGSQVALQGALYNWPDGTELKQIVAWFQKATPNRYHANIRGRGW